MSDPAGGSVALSWSGGKDSVLALRALRAAGAAVSTLLVVVTEEDDRLAAHRVPVTLVHNQAAALGLAMREVRLPEWPANERYEAAMAEAAAGLREAGVTGLAFGDVHLADVRAYREAVFGAAGLEVRFPLWGREPARLSRELITAGYRAIVVCVDTESIDPSFCGRTLDAAMLAELPVGVDPAGENGEFHTFVAAGPAFSAPVGLTRAAAYQRGRFRYQELLPE